mmetsp:Transcript_56782/g.166180  ORF Transcript_56782/g.166180 Transcript_56782/m.166180 type:complete len:141 (+) Transcript_56782:91-513(+)
MQVVTKEELARHSTPSDCWLAVHGLVYDVTPFLPDHPGGSDIVEALAGQDASMDFEDALHSTVARQEPKIVLKGVLQGWEAQVKKFRKQGWSEDQGIPDVNIFLDKKSSGDSGDSLGLALALGAVGALAAVWLAARARRG